MSLLSGMVMKKKRRTGMKGRRKLRVAWWIPTKRMMVNSRMMWRMRTIILIMMIINRLVVVGNKNLSKS